ncbi:hypothetical protein H2684_06705 [Clostridium sp. cel8]|jgi:polyhydroxyalkanoate synthesis regulator phasin|uniref:hypothetical protein n=1 Tax=Clostridium sp. cel8 TaxID=2663123 RepID=UPI0015F5A7B7|nr:hypothetical protein [Clostridium sp. cel8]MBA5850994.1 hypothetical protein [Clostridium sp. cel8]
MKKHKFLGKIITCVIAMSLSMMVLAGCGNSSTSTDETTSETTTESSSTTENSSDSNTTDASTTDENTSEVSESERKEKIEEGIQELVDDGTITEEQGKKIIIAYSSGNKPNPKNNPENGEDSQSGDAQPKDGEGKNGGAKGGANKNPLSKLVEDGTITQDQADAVMEKLAPDNANE